MLHVLLYIQHGRIIVSDAFCSVLHATVQYTKKGYFTETGDSLFLNADNPYSDRLAAVSFFRHQPAKRTFMHPCMCGFHSYSTCSHMYRESHSRHVGSYSSKRKKK